MSRIALAVAWMSLGCVGLLACAGPRLYVDKVELKALELAKELFKCDYADVRPTSGTVANIGILKTLGKHGDPITHTALSDGAHISYDGGLEEDERGLKYARMVQ